MEDLEKEAKTATASTVGNYELSKTRVSLSILPRLLASCRQQLSKAVPGSCLLCAEDCGNRLLCSACENDLPALPGKLCPQCLELTTFGEKCGACLHRPPHFSRAHALFAYAFPVDRMIQALKYGHQLPLADWFGQQLAKTMKQPTFDCLIPLPLHPQRLRERGFNQALEIARPLARKLGLPIDQHSLIRQLATPPQAGLPLTERLGNVRNAFACRGELAGRRILLIDDVLTSGATASECARTLRLHGAGDVVVAVVARALHR